MSDFNLKQREAQIIWRKGNISKPDWGRQNGKDYEHIVPKSIWKETLWRGIQKTLPKYIKDNGVQKHSGVHNLLSSWILSVNLYFPIKEDENFKDLMLKFLQTKISSKITKIAEIKLEFAFPENDALHPSNLLGEQDGNRGSGQTSPDVAFLVETEKGKGIILTECKYTEHSFYRCSARQTNNKGERKGNPDASRCLNSAKGYNYKNICHQTVWGRKYWSLLNLSPTGETLLNRCPAATAGYQLFRQQALAEGIANSGRFDLIVSSVAFDERNKTLVNSLKRTGINDFQKDWTKMFKNNAIFETWTHQEWVQFVRANNSKGIFNNWLDYMNERYGY